MKKIEDVKVHQSAEEMENVTGVAMQLNEGDDIHLKNAEIIQNANKMKGVTGLNISAPGTQSARLQGVTIQQPGGEIVISSDPNAKIWVNKHD